MSKDDDTGTLMFKSSDEVTRWVNREITDAARAFSLRVRELKEIAEQTSKGAIDTRQAEALHDRYYERWGDALPTAKENASDAEIYAALDKEVQYHSTRLSNRRGSSRGLT